MRLLPRGQQECSRTLRERCERPIERDYRKEQEKQSN